MRIGIDARLSGTKHAGIGRYTQNLILELIKLNKKHTLICFFFDQNQVNEVLGKFSNSNKVKIVLAPVRHYTVQEQLEMPKIFSHANLNLLHVPHFNIPVFYKGKLIITIHDLLWHEYKGISATTLNPLVYLFKYLFYRLVTRIAIFKANRIIVPAETIKKTVIRFYPKAKNKIAITKEGATISKSINKKRFHKFKKTFLYVGSLYPHKNLKLILQALSSLPEYKLLIAGSRNVFQDEVRNFIKYKEIEHQVEFLGYVSDEKLKELYQRVTALVQPSLSEGFGLTGVEAMSLGSSVLASDIPIFREIYQNAAFYFSPHSTASFIQAVHSLEKKSEKINQEGIRLAKNYSWKKMATDTLNLYNQILNIS